MVQRLSMILMLLALALPGRAQSLRSADVTTQAGMRTEAPGHGAAVGDFDGDGWQDVFVDESGAVRVEIVDLHGRRVATIAARVFAAGRHAIPFRDATLAGGVYFYRLLMDGRAEVRKMVLIR